MMKIKPLITTMSIAALSTTVSLSALAAPIDSSRPLAVRNVDKIADLAVKTSLNIQENRSHVTSSNSAVAESLTKTDTKLSADNMSVEELTR